MIKAKHHVIIYPLFQWLTRLLLKRNFHSVAIEGEFKDNGHAVFVIANHISWWDGFWIMYLNLKVIRRRVHFMMLEEQLKKHWYFQYTGGYSIKKKTRDIMESLNYTIEILNHKENMVFMFPQGRIQSLYNDAMEFEKGVERILKNTLPDTQVLFVANMVDYFSDPKPNLFIYLKTTPAKILAKFPVEQEYNRFYAQATEIQKAKVS